MLKKLFHYSDNFFSSLRKSLQKVCRRILVDIHFCHCQAKNKLLPPETKELEERLVKTSNGTLRLKMIHGFSI